MNDYTGTDNLEIMSDAVKYNSFLEDLILKNINTGDKILDFGAGIGTFASLLKDRNLDINCIEVDASQASTIAAQDINVSTSTEHIPDNTYDYIYSLNVLEHIEDEKYSLDEIHRILKPGGKVLIYVPAMQVLFSAMDKKVGHFRRYSIPGLTTCAKNSGFSVLKCNYADSLGFFATLLYKVLGNKNGSINKTSLIIYDKIFFPLSRLMDIFLAKVLGKNVYAVLTKLPRA